jgi:hypothetical protein
LLYDQSDANQEDDFFAAHKTLSLTEKEFSVHQRYTQVGTHVNIAIQRDSSLHMTKLKSENLHTSSSDTNLAGMGRRMSQTPTTSA